MVLPLPTTGSSSALTRLLRAGQGLEKKVRPGCHPRGGHRPQHELEQTFQPQPCVLLFVQQVRCIPARSRRAASSEGAKAQEQAYRLLTVLLRLLTVLPPSHPPNHPPPTPLTTPLPPPSHPPTHCAAPSHPPDCCKCVQVRVKKAVQPGHEWRASPQSCQSTL
jgi:hypothetical protein